MNKNEFDQYIKNYRKNLNKTLSISGETSDFFAQYKAQKLYSWFPSLHNKNISILDFGCGDGAMTSYVQKQFVKAKIFGTDPSHLSIERATKQYPKITFSQLKENKIDYQTNTFDLVYAAGVFHHIDQQEHECFYSQIMRVLRPGGRFVLFELNPYNPLTQITFRRCPIDKNATMISTRSAKKLLSQAGETKTIYYCFFPAFLKKLRALEKYLTWLPLGALYASIVKKEDPREKI
ncbi:class I SAM-dependent methyltransferase [Candidatus Dependentiae bacterium]|nr:class I SAM-dependent methyltransferase [Candidatus Dependentiae bacterium]